MQYAPGDHVGIIPANPPDLVDAILSRLHNAPLPDQVIRTEFLQETSTPLGECEKVWHDEVRWKKGWGDFKPKVSCCRRLPRFWMS